MKLSKIKYGIFLLLLINIINSCKKNADTIDDIPPTITLVEPTPNDTYASLTGDCHVEFSAGDNINLDGVIVNITNFYGANVYTNSIKINGKEYDFHDHLVVAGLISTTAFTLKIEVIDKAGNKETKMIPFFLKP